MNAEQLHNLRENVRRLQERPGQCEEGARALQNLGQPIWRPGLFGEGSPHGRLRRPLIRMGQTRTVRIGIIGTGAMGSWAADGRSCGVGNST